MDPNKLIASLSSQKPFSLLDIEQQNNLFRNSCYIRFKPGQLMIRPDEIPRQVFIVASGSIRLLAKSTRDEEPITLGKRGRGQLVGWISLLRADPTEWIIASEETIVLAIPAEDFIVSLKSCEVFAKTFNNLSSLHETFLVCKEVAANSVYLSPDWDDDFNLFLEKSLVVPAHPGKIFEHPFIDRYNWFISTYKVLNLKSPPDVNFEIPLPQCSQFIFPLRIIGLPKDFKGLTSNINSQLNILESDDSLPGANLSSLGILEDDALKDQQKFPIITGKGVINEALAVCEMIAISQNVPFRKDILEKVLEDSFRRDKSLSLQMLGRLCELLGMSCQLASVDPKFIDSIEAPSIVMQEGTPCVIHQINKDNVIYAHARDGLKKDSCALFGEAFGDQISLLIPRRIASTPTSRFGWNWFTPLIVKYKTPLILVFVSSLLAQLFGLAIPLLIQQIIDKVLSQGNLSSLNVIGTVMIVLALFQGLLMALRTFIFVDTTDRMDLTLGSAVIDRLLALPLSFFEKRPVGELSQRLGELNTIRSFLTGTALVSVLNIIFAAIYLIVMIIYSPLLSVVALSTIPLYIVLVFSVAPIYKSLIRKRAVAQARTQSHLIEILGGIQTVKAQHFELTARWKWQDRYRVFVDQGFRSVALGASSGEIGKFLNTLSSLLVLWVGMWLVLEGELTLGMLIAFRIISGNVTGPLLQLSGLYQSFQGVQLSMERLSDIIDQNPEFANADDLNQIPLPPIKGNIRFENVSFRFNQNGPYQVENVSLKINVGEFVAIVGQSGSGKSTLMKLLPRLYSSELGRIFIDDYDIEKVNLSSLRRQIGIVPQDSLLFEGTISDNIALNDPQATSDSIIEAAKIACAHDFIMSLGKGYATKLSERGSNLSGGQRQRIAIARTILANPQLLVMDEATSALDYNTENQLCKNLQNWAAGRTVLFITHRLGSIKNSDRIFVMHNGKLDESGTHLELMTLNGRYSALYQQQGE